MIHRVLCMLATALLLVSSGSADAGAVLRIEAPAAGTGLLARGFELTRDAAVRIEAVGLAERQPIAFSVWPLSTYRQAEGDRAFLVYAWLLDASTRRPVWVMDESATSPIAQTPRLRRGQTSLRLSAGRYELYVFSRVEAPTEPGTDERGTRPWWNRAIDYFAGDEDQQLVAECFAALSADSISAAELERYDVTGDLPGALIRLNRLGDSELRHAGFELRRPAALRLYGMVERYGNSAADFAWLVDAVSRKVVWQSWAGDRPPAGGSDKNRLIDEGVRLEAGRYVLSYGTDDSHAFPKFNANPPADPFNWGITVLPAAADFDPATFSLFAPSPPEPLVTLIEVGDGESIEQPFRLERDAQLHVRALGERMGNDPFADFAAITEADTGRVVWEMDAAETMPAGGAAKNRLFDGVVRLRRGSYVLRYRSDDSHSYPQWNSSPPFEPRAWGVVLYPAPGAARPAFELVGSARRRAERATAQ